MHLNADYSVQHYVLPTGTNSAHQLHLFQIGGGNLWQVVDHA